MWAAALALIALPVVAPRLTERPHLPGLVFLLLHLLGARWLSGTKTWAASLLPGALLVVSVPLWAATHGSWPLALVVAGAHTLGGRPERRLAFVLLGAGEILASLANPYGLKLLSVPWQHVANPDVSRYITEWMDPTLSLSGTEAAVTLALLAAFSLGAGLMRRRADLPEVLIALALFVMAWRSYRFVTPALLVALAPTAARAAMLAASRPRGLRATLWCGALVVAAAAHVFMMRPVWTTRATGLHWETRGLPRAAARTIKENGLRGNIFNDFDIGDDLCWTLGESVPHAIDGRVNLFRAHWLRAYVELLRDPSLFGEHARAHYVQMVLLSHGTPRNAALLSHVVARPDFELIHLDETYALLARGNALRAARSKGLVLERLRPHVDPERMFRGPVDGRTYTEIERVRADARPPLGDMLWIEARWRELRAANALDDAGVMRTVADRARAALEAHPGMLYLRMRHGQARLRAGDPAAALPDLIAAVAAGAPKSASEDLERAFKSLPRDVAESFVEPLVRRAR